jgi:hypothetical protein
VKPLEMAVSLGGGGPTHSIFGKSLEENLLGFNSRILPEKILRIGISTALRKVFFPYGAGPTEATAYRGT